MLRIWLSILLVLAPCLTLAGNVAAPTSAVPSLLGDETVRINAELRGANQKTTLAGVVRFTQETLAVPGGAGEVLDDIAARLKADKRLDVVLVGHADISGSREYSVALSDKRLSAVEAELLQRGVKKAQIRRNISGQRGDATACSTIECRHAALNVEMHLSN